MEQKRADRRAAVNEAVVEISTANPAEPLPTSEQPPRFVGRSRGVIHISDEDLIDLPDR